MTARYRTTLLTSLFCGLFGLACAGELDPRFNQTGAGGTSGGTGGQQTCDAPNTIFVPMCAISGCHTATGSLNAGLDLSDPATVAANLLNKGPTQGGVGASSCGSAGKPYIQPGTSPATGLLLDKLQASPACGMVMPFGTMLAQEQINCIQTWATSVAN